MYKKMEHLLEYDELGTGGKNPHADNPYPYKTLNPGQITHYRGVLNMHQRKNEYALNVLATVEKNGGKCSLKQWNVIDHYYNGGGTWPVRY